MDIAKYIGLFLLKNQYCYIHGLGNMELKRRAASHDGSNLQGGGYEVTVTPGGSIDDNLANFIATNEQISISKAANALREYSTQAKTDIFAGKDVIIPNIGKFAAQDGKIRFVTDENFKYTPVGIPIIKNSKQLDEQNARPAHVPSFPPPQKANSVNWSMVILVIVLLLIVGGGGYGIYYYMQQNKPAPVAPAPAKVDTVKPAPAPVVDTSHIVKDTVKTAPAVDTNAVSAMQMVIGSYATKERAEKRVRNLKINGNHVESIQKDSTTFLVVASVNCRIVDTAHMKDSLQKLFGYHPVVLYKP